MNRKPRKTFEVVHQPARYWAVFVFAVFLGGNVGASLYWIADAYGRGGCMHYDVISHLFGATVLMVSSLLGLPFYRF